jgi:hypothetical protein
MISSSAYLKRRRRQYHSAPDVPRDVHIQVPTGHVPRGTVLHLQATRLMQFGVPDPNEIESPGGTSLPEVVLSPRYAGLRFAHTAFPRLAPGATLCSPAARVQNLRRCLLSALAYRQSLGYSHLLMHLAACDRGIPCSAQPKYRYRELPTELPAIRSLRRDLRGGLAAESLWDV